MEKTTVLHFVGSLADEFPELLSSSYRMASGDVLSWINASIKVVDSVGGIVKLCLDKKNTKLLRDEIDNFDHSEHKYQSQLEQAFLMKKLSAVNEMKKDFEHNKKELIKKYTSEKNDIYSSEIKKSRKYLIL